ncbi:MAG: hypothetical protein JSV91_14205 [Phycisphaerales bacterium]|nr:MAG: hypothetical protein JSV91_14205 [Phycisphaerales bacterium]
MRHLQFIVTALLLMLAVGCSEGPPVDPVARASDNEDVCEAVLRHQFADNAAWAGRQMQAYFILVNREEPTEDFLARFAGNSPPVRNGLDFTAGAGILFRVDQLEWSEDNSYVEVYGSYDAGPQSKAKCRYKATRQNGEWAVTTEQKELGR